MRMIGVTPSQDDKTGRITINQDYLDAITRAGALPVLLPLTAEEQQTFHDCCDGIRKNMEHLKDL